MFDEPYRPQFHFTPPQGKINDPNGLCYFNGEWHLFYQLIDPSLGLGSGLVWGHAVSRDLLHWQHLTPAIVPDRHGVIWSGSAVVDHHDTSGLFGGKGGMVCLFTYFDPADGYQCQGLAHSADGRTFTTLDRPVIGKWKDIPSQKDDKDFRDPKIFWHAPTARWIMAVAGGRLRIYSSKNLRDWQFESMVEEINTECPDLMQMPIDGDAGNTTWLLSGGGRWYQLGDFDGKRFTPSTPRIPTDYGPDYYATQTWDNAPGRYRQAISWLFNWQYETGNPHPFPTSPWERGLLTAPVRWSLRTTIDGVRLFQTPDPRLKLLRQNLYVSRNCILAPGDPNPLVTGIGKTFDFSVTFSTSNRLVLSLPAERPQYVIEYDAERKELALDRTKSGITTPENFSKRYTMPLPPREDGTVMLRVLIDHCSIEILAGRGEKTMTAIVFPDPQRGGMTLEAIDGPCQIHSLRLHAMKSAVLAPIPVGEAR